MIIMTDYDVGWSFHSVITRYRSISP